ncbi:RNA polymerase sigma factor [Aquisphaera insulae]|uniref:RNA polymerase sigma factor n=1 Tax=Aquisphaera insulae TaxID=2712864 RepID=UPI0013EC68EB|nr:sigma-70 family RNA polymerase sigma factor [Aquisphaera insulae]
MYPSTTEENFRSWDRFLDAYSRPIRSALRLLPFVGEARADEVAHGFFLKMYDRDLLANRPAITGRFRDWLYVAARRHAVDEWRKTQRRPERPAPFPIEEHVDPRAGDPEAATFDVDELYALGVLHLATERVRSQLIDAGKAEHWTVFEELVLAPLFPGRVPKTREELLAMFPGQPPVILDNRVTTVKRIFRRILPALIPGDPAAGTTREERLQELIEIAARSARGRLWLAFLRAPRPEPEDVSGSSLHLPDGFAPGSGREEVDPEILDDELRILLGLWLNLPLQEYLDDLESVGPALAAVLRETRPSATPGGRIPVPLTLRALVAGKDSRVSGLPLEELVALLKRVKVFAKQVHRAAGRESRSDARPMTSMPVDVAHVLYALAAALAFTRCETRILGVDDDRFRRILKRALAQHWLDPEVRPVLTAAVDHLSSP